MHCHGTWKGRKDPDPIYAPNFMTPVRLLTFFCLVALAFGAGYRLIPLFGSDRTLASFFITEDGYLLLTVARNIAIGNGMSVSDGTIPTNGVQPLITFIFTIPYLLTGGDKLASLVGVTLIQAVIAVLGTIAVHRFARRALAPQTDMAVWSLLVTAIWFTGPLLMRHSMNGLETGLYTLMVIVTLLYFGQVLARGGRYTGRDQLILGLLCGLVFLARIDGAFLVTALFLVRFIQIQLSRQANFAGAVIEALPPGILSLVVAAPWLIYNYTLFGSIMPISGTAQSRAAEFGSNLGLGPVKLFETMLPMLPVPGSLETATALAVILLAFVLAVVAWFLIAITRRGDYFRPVLYAYALYALAIAAYYSLYFGAPWFLARYFAPLAPFLILAAVSVVYDLSSLVGRARETVLGLAGMTALALCLGLLVWFALPGVRAQGHFQVVDWVTENVPQDAWLGAVQTGTVGYWHDRTINLDGKVNPEALRVLIETGSVLDYVVDSEITYLADWAGIAGWAETPNSRFAKTFEVLVEDQDRDLAALRRRPDS